MDLRSHLAGDFGYRVHHNGTARRIDDVAGLQWRQMLGDAPGTHHSRNAMRLVGGRDHRGVGCRRHPSESCRHVQRLKLPGASDQHDLPLKIFPQRRLGDGVDRRKSSARRRQHQPFRPLRPVKRCAERALDGQSMTGIDRRPELARDPPIAHPLDVQIERVRPIAALQRSRGAVGACGKATECEPAILPGKHFQRCLGLDLKFHHVGRELPQSGELRLDAHGLGQILEFYGEVGKHSGLARIDHARLTRFSAHGHPLAHPRQTTSAAAGATIMRQRNALQQGGIEQDRAASCAERYSVGRYFMVRRHLGPPALLAVCDGYGGFRNDRTRQPRSCRQSPAARRCLSAAGVCARA